MIEKLMIKIYGANWKTSLNGDLTFLITVGTFASGYLVLTPNSPHWMIVSSGIITFSVAGCRLAVGRIQIDAGQVTAILPGENSPEVTPSHEVPDVKGAKVVKN